METTTIERIARAHGVRPATVIELAAAIRRGGGRRAQFDIAELGGMGHWISGGMTMAGGGSRALRARVDEICEAIVFVLDDVARSGDAWWPTWLRFPDAQGSQGDRAFAFFSGARRVAVREGNRVRLFATDGRQVHAMTPGRSGDKVPWFSGPDGRFCLAEIGLVDDEDDEDNPCDINRGARDDGGRRSFEDDIIDAIQRLGKLHKAGVLTDVEFTSKKTELLARL